MAEKTETKVAKLVLEWDNVTRNDRGSAEIASVDEAFDHAKGLMSNAYKRGQKLKVVATLFPKNGGERILFDMRTYGHDLEAARCELWGE